MSCPVLKCLCCFTFNRGSNCQSEIGESTRQFVGTREPCGRHHWAHNFLKIITRWYRAAFGCTDWSPPRLPGGGIIGIAPLGRLDFWVDMFWRTDHAAGARELVAQFQKVAKWTILARTVAMPPRGAIGWKMPGCGSPIVSECLPALVMRDETDGFLLLFSFRSLSRSLSSSRLDACRKRLAAISSAAPAGVHPLELA